MKLIVFDFEVFKHDVLLGLYVVDNENRTKKELYQTWDKTEIKKIYHLFKDDIWIGHNNLHYDNYILSSIILDKDPFQTSTNIVEKRITPNFRVPLNSFDLMDQVFISLKYTEAYWGKKIDILNEVPWDIDRPLTDEEKKSVESYNQSDLEQTYENFLGLAKTFDLKLSLMEDFNMDYSVLTKSSSNISAYCLGVKRKSSLKSLEKPYLFKELSLSNKNVLDWYFNRRYKEESLVININGVEHQLGIGGIHGARNTWYLSDSKKLHKDDKQNYQAISDDENTILYLDVSGYYNLLMINYDLFSRSMTQESKDKYTHMYHEQLRLKKIDPKKRKQYKLILLAVFGATKNKYTEYYDPDHFEMITLNGQLFLIDLLEKLDPYMELIQSNTDGIIIKIKNKDQEAVNEVIKEWENRTRFVLKKERVKKIIQRDVNNYILEKEDGAVEVKGEALKYVETYKDPFYSDFGAFISKLPLVISLMLRDAFIEGVLPEESINRYKNELRLFQFICKKDTFDHLELVEDDKSTVIQNITRAFPCNDGRKSTIVKVDETKKTPRVKIANLPESIFIYNDDVRPQEVVEKLSQLIDWDWYIKKTYDRMKEFLI